jgi:hypothetical protein
MNNKNEKSKAARKAPKYKALYQAAYAAMSTSVLTYDCGSLCNHNCCRNDYKDPENFGVYLLPFEYEHLLKETGMIKSHQLVRHSAKDHYIPKSVGALNYFLCDAEKDCLRDYRPIQCRTYPLEPHLENDVLTLVVEKDQIHACPLINMKDQWQKDYVEGIYKGWSLLIQIPDVRRLVVFDSQVRKREGNILYSLSANVCE